MKVGGTSLVVQWLRICLPLQRTWIWSLARELRSHTPCLKIPCHARATRPTCCNYRAYVLQLRPIPCNRRPRAPRLRPSAAKQTQRVRVEVSSAFLSSDMPQDAGARGFWVGWYNAGIWEVRMHRQRWATRVCWWLQLPVVMSSGPDSRSAQAAVSLVGGQRWLHANTAASSGLESPLPHQQKDLRFLMGIKFSSSSKAWKRLIKSYITNLNFNYIKTYTRVSYLLISIEADLNTF